MRHIWGFKHEVIKVSSADFDLARRYAGGRIEAFAETLARAIFDDIERGMKDGGSYTMDGRRVSEGADAYAVGNAAPNTTVGVEEALINSYEDVKAAIELLREVISDLERDTDDDVIIGYWWDELNDCWDFDASNISYDYDEAMSLARSRGEQAIWYFGSSDVIMVKAARRSNGRWSQGASSGWATWNRQNRNGR